MSDKCFIPFTSCPFIINEGDDFTRRLTWLQYKGGPPVDLTGFLAELWVKPRDSEGDEFLVSSNGTTTTGTSIAIDGPNGIVTIFMNRTVIPDLKLSQGAQSRFDLTDTEDVRTPQFRAEFIYAPKYADNE